MPVALLERSACHFGRKGGGSWGAKTPACVKLTNLSKISHRGVAGLSRFQPPTPFGKATETHWKKIIDISMEKIWDLCLSSRRGAGFGHRPCFTSHRQGLVASPKHLLSRISSHTRPFPQRARGWTGSESQSNPVPHLFLPLSFQRSLLFQ